MKALIMVNGKSLEINTEEGLTFEEAKDLVLLELGFKRKPKDSLIEINAKDESSENYVDIIVTDAMKKCINSDVPKYTDILERCGNKVEEVATMILEMAEKAGFENRGEAAKLIADYLKKVKTSTYKFTEMVKEINRIIKERTIKEGLVNPTEITTGFFGDLVTPINKSRKQTKFPRFQTLDKSEETVDPHTKVVKFEKLEPTEQPKNAVFTPAVETTVARPQTQQPPVQPPVVKPQVVKQETKGFEPRNINEIKASLSKAGNQRFTAQDEYKEKETLVSQFVDLSTCRCTNEKGVRNVIDRLHKIVVNPQAVQYIYSFNPIGRFVFSKFDSHNKFTLVSSDGGVFINILSWNDFTVGRNEEFCK